MNIEEEIGTLIELREEAAQGCNPEMTISIDQVMFTLRMQERKIKKLQEKVKASQAICTVTENSLNNAIETIRELRR